MGWESERKQRQKEQFLLIVHVSTIKNLVRIFQASFRMEEVFLRSKVINCSLCAVVMGRKVSVSEDAARSNSKVLFYITSPTYMYFWDALFAVG